MTYKTAITIKETLESIGRKEYVLPAIQRELVWAQDPDRMTRLFDSILRGYPIGTFLFWKVPPEQSTNFNFYEFMRQWHERDHRHNDPVYIDSPRPLTAILDGQQRLSTLNIGLHGSLAHKLPRKRMDSVGAYPAKQLHLDLLFQPTEDDDLQYRLQFLTPEQASAAGEAHWYRVGDILDVPDSGTAIFTYVQQHGLAETNAFGVLNRLWSAVHQDGTISYFEEREQSLSKVLDIFVRVNSGGVVLTKSDLLLSIATAQFTGRDAREQVHQLVDDLNATKPGFKFTKDLVLKAGLVITDISDVGFRVENFTAENMRTLDEKWEDIERALRVGVKLLASFGFSESTLPAASVLIPVADYIHQRGLDENYVTSAADAVRADREVVRAWTIRTILKPGIWGSALDQLLRGLHQTIKSNPGTFPMEALEAEMARRGKSLAIDADLLEELVDTPYKHKRAFALLTLLYGWVDVRNNFHIDHVFPRSLATRAKLRDHGVPESDWDEVMDKVERLGNLQLLEGSENIQKRAQLPADWVRNRYPQTEQRQAWLLGHDLYDLPADLTDFLTFYEIRRETIRDGLHKLFGTAPSTIRQEAAAAPAAPVQTPELDAVPSEPQVRSLPRQTQAETSARNFLGRGDALRRLVDDGVLLAGTQLSGKYQGRRYETTVRSDGRLETDGELFDTPSQAARLTTGQKAVNGWAFWQLDDGTPVGDLRTSV